MNPVTPKVLKNYYPCYPYWVNQKFGEVAPLYTSMGLLGHDGVDLLAGEQICASANEGIVTDKSLDVNRGLGVYVTTENEYNVGLDKPYRVSIVYWHFRQDDVNIGDRVKVGDRLGITDNTGASSGNHCHFAVQPRIVDASGSLVIALPNNGYRGFIDPAPFWNGMYAFQFQNDLYFGMNNEEVKVLQAYLGGLPTTGFFGPQTLSKVRSYQKAHGILSTGYCGIKTRTAINNELRTKKI